MSEITPLRYAFGVTLYKLKHKQMIKTDSSGNAYIETVMPNNETVRVSKIMQGWTGGECYRINLVDTNNHVRMGAEFPKDNVQGVIDALNQLK